MLSDPRAALPGDIPMDTIWSTLDAANELCDSHTVAACRRAIDARLRGEIPSQSDLDAIATFFA